MNVLLVGNYRADKQESMLRFADALLAGLCEAGVSAEIIRPEPWFGRLRPRASGLGKWLGYLDKFVLFPPRLCRLASRADLIHICDQANSMYVSWIAAQPHIVTCNDMLAIRVARGEFSPRRTRLTGRLLQSWILSGLRRARRLVCISEATRRDVLRLTGQAPASVSVTYMGQNYPYAPVREIARASESRRCGDPFDAAAFSRHGLPAEPYILHVGGDPWYKNRPGVLAMHRALEARLGERTPRLVLVGPPVESAGPRVEVRSSVSNEALAALYSGAELLLFPSLEEGFGWPIIESQACGCRVVTTGKPPMTEVGGAAAMYLEDPEDAEAGATRITEVLAQDATARKHLIEAGIANAARFSTAAMVQQYVAIYRKLLAG